MDGLKFPWKDSWLLDGRFIAIWRLRKGVRSQWNCKRPLETQKFSKNIRLLSWSFTLPKHCRCLRQWPKRMVQTNQSERHHCPDFNSPRKYGRRHTIQQSWTSFWTDPGIRFLPCWQRLALPLFPPWLEEYLQVRSRLCQENNES